MYDMPSALAQVRHVGTSVSDQLVQPPAALMGKKKGALLGHLVAWLVIVSDGAETRPPGIGQTGPASSFGDATSMIVLPCDWGWRRLLGQGS